MLAEPARLDRQCRNQRHDNGELREHSNGCGQDRLAKLGRGMYLRELVGHLKSGLGALLRKEGEAASYVYELLDDEELGGDRLSMSACGEFCISI